MRKSNLIAVTVAAICFVAAPLAHAQGGNPPASTKESGQTSGHGMTAVEQTTDDSNTVEIKQQIARLADQTIEAFAKADVSFMEKYFADELMAVHSDGKLSTKAQEIDNVKSGALKWASVDTHERTIHVYGDTALVVGLASSKGSLGGKPYSGDYRTTQLWVKRNGNWKMAAFQSTRVAGSQ